MYTSIYNMKIHYSNLTISNIIIYYNHLSSVIYIACKPFITISHDSKTRHDIK